MPSLISLAVVVAAAFVRERRGRRAGGDAGGAGGTASRRGVETVDEPFIINVAAAPAISHSRRATVIKLEPDDVQWPDTGVNIRIMQPGQPSSRYHSEPVQEDFLVLHGECIVILGSEERSLRQWDFLHCPAGIEHVFVGAGDGPCAVLMIGSRREDARRTTRSTRWRRSTARP